MLLQDQVLPRLPGSQRSPRHRAAHQGAGRCDLRRLRMVSPGEQLHLITSPYIASRRRAFTQHACMCARGRCVTFSGIVMLVGMCALFIMSDVAHPRTLHGFRCYGWFPQCDIMHCVDIGDKFDRGIPSMVRPACVRVSECKVSVCCLACAHVRVFACVLHRSLRGLTVL